MRAAQSCPNLCDPMDYTVHGILHARILEWVAFPFSQGSSQPRTETSFPTLQADSLPAESQGKPKNTGMGSVSLLQWIFPTQELNQSLLHCRQILYQLIWGKPSQNVYGTTKDPEAKKNNEILPFATMWMDLENNMLSLISQRKNGTICYYL